MKEAFGVKNLKVENGIHYVESIKKDISFPDDSHEKLAEIEDKSFWFIHRNEIISHVVKKLKVNGLFFDIGGGNGAVSKRLMLDGLNPVLVEPYEFGNITARDRGIKNLICSDLHSLDFSEKIQFAGSFDVIEHIEDDKSFVSEIYKNMKVGGLFFATVPSFQFLWSVADVEAGHFRRYSMAQINALMTECGFKVVYKSYFFTYLLPLIFLLGRKERESAGDEHVVEGYKKHILSFLNFLDKVICKLSFGRFPGASIIIVGQKQ